MSTFSKILISVLIIAVISGGIFLFLKNKLFLKEEANINQTVEEEKAEEEVVIPTLDEETKLKLELQRTASSFAERYGSYSNQSNYENISELKSFMTKAMQNWADSFVEQARAKEPDKIYYGIFTRSLNSQIESFDTQQVVVKVNCQKKEETGEPLNSKTYYQTAKITFFKEEGAWKVAQIKWE